MRHDWLMFIRATRVRRKNGSSIVHRLVQSERFGDKVRQRTLLNLGVGYDVPRERWREVAQLTRRLFHGEQPLIEPEPEVRRAAEHLVRRLRARGEELEKGPRRATVDLDTLDHEGGVRSVGGERVSLAALEQLGFGELLRGAGFSERDARIATALVIAKMLYPTSELGTERWLREESATLELLGLAGGLGVSDTKLLRIGDALWRRRHEVQEGLYGRARSLFGEPEAIVFYDLTNTWHTGGRTTEGELLRFGRSKQKRSDCRLVTLGLALDGAGFVRQFEVLPGNVSEPATLEGSVRRLEGGLREGERKPTVVMDAGIATEENLGWLREQGYDWITVSRSKRPAPPEGEPEAQLRAAAGHEVRAWRLGEESGELRLCAVSEGRKATDEAALARYRARYEGELTRLHEGLTIRYRMKRHDRVVEKVGRLKERFARVGKQYEVKVEKGKGPNATAVKWNRREKYEEADASAGAYLLRTSHRDWKVEKVLRTYWRLTGVEATFRSLKVDLGLRPIWHRKDARIAAHLFIALLAYHAVRLIRTRLGAAGIRSSWSTLRDRLRPWGRVTTTMRTEDGSLIVNRQDVRVGAELAEVGRVMGVRRSLYRRRHVEGAGR